MLSSMQIIILLPFLLSTPFTWGQLVSPVSSQPCGFPAIFNFGDSNSDTGGLSAVFGPVVLPYGETFFGTPAGRYADGRLIIDFIAEGVGLPFLSAYLDSVGSDFSHGANFATAGSEILHPATKGSSPVTLDVQLAQFLEFKSRSQLVYKRGGVSGGLMPKEEYFSQALYTFDIGQNDLTAKYFVLNKTADEYIPAALKLFSEVIKSIYEIGGRHFWIHNTGPLGCLPYILLKRKLAASQLDSLGCGILYNELAQLFNRMLLETVMQLRRELPLADITYVDVYTVKYMLISQAANNGFDDPLTTCCGYRGGKRSNNDLKVRCEDTAAEVTGKSCESPSKKMNWDGIHYTEAANKLVFSQIATGLFSDPPISLTMACNKMAS